MQVKKFEARTMKEALEMVKTQLGPDAIILSAKDNSKSYGLVGESSFEITAAVSEETLHKKKFVESKLRDEDKNRFQQSSARTQKEIINKFVSKHIGKQYSAGMAQQSSTVQQNSLPNQIVGERPITTRRYIDIDDEKNLAEERIRNAAQNAFSVFSESDVSLTQQNKKRNSGKQIKSPSINEVQSQLNQMSGKALDNRSENNSNSNTGNASANQPNEISALKNEIMGLKTMLSELQNNSRSHNQASLNAFPVAYPGSQYGVHFDLANSYKTLINEGVHEELALEMILDVQNEIPATKYKNKSLVDGVLAKKILDTVLLSHSDDKKFQFFIGPSGSGKTSAMIKMASQIMVKENKKIAILTTDTFKVGAVEQLRIYSQILNVPFAVIRSASDWNEIVKLSDSLDYLFIDFPGMSLKRQDEINYLETLIPSNLNSKSIHLVLSAMNKLEDLNDLLNRYSLVSFDDVIFNHLDESARSGHIYSFARMNQIPLNSFGIGSRIPEDIEPATRERIVDLIFKITQKTNAIKENKNSEATI